MAKLGRHNTQNVQDGTALAVLATLGMLVCMICALLGIKIWWFKHRLTFDHSNTNNGTAGGAQPAVAMRPRSNKEKRLSQQFREPVEVHGVFRKRQEDELDIVPTTQLPPVRIRKLSQSTPSLWLPQKKRADNALQPIPLEKLAPPTREPPKPPISPADSLPSLPTPTIDYDEAPMFAEFEQRFQKMEITRPVSMDAALFLEQERLTPPQPPKRLNRNSSNNLQVSEHRFLKARSISEPEGKKVAERRPTGFIRPTEEELHMLEDEEEDHKKGYIKYEEIDNDGLADFHSKWDTLKYEMATNAPTNHFEHYASERKSYQAVIDQHFMHFNTFTTEESPIVHDISTEPKWPTAQLATTVQKVETISWDTQRNSSGTPQSLPSVEYASEENESELAVPTSILKHVETKHFKSYDEHFVEDYDWKVEKDIVAQRNVKFAMQPVEEDEEKAPTLKLRRPTGYVRRETKSWEDLEASLKPEENESSLWLEMERDINQDFICNIEDEFNKIRNSYEENEAEFLETKYLGNDDNADTTIVPRPKGYGKNIDEDWENFEKLESVKEPLDHADNVRISPLGSDEDYADHATVKFNMPYLDDTNDKESLLRTARRPTGYVHNVKEIHQELEFIDGDGLHKCEYNTKIQFDEQAHVVEKKNESTSILKERRPTSYISHSAHSLDADNTAPEDYKNNIFEPLEERKPKPRQKVTFDFNTTEHSYQPHELEHDHTDSDAEAYDSEEDEYNTTSAEVPKPMQRMTKMLYTEEYSKVESPSPPPLLFGTQISLEDLEADINDSWSAIRQRRFLNEELQPYATEPAIPEPPKPAYRNPLAQIAVTSRIETEEISVPTPRTMQEEAKPRPHSRHHFSENYGTNTTEA